MTITIEIDNADLAATVTGVLSAMDRGGGVPERPIGFAPVVEQAPVAAPESATTTTATTATKTRAPSEAAAPFDAPRLCPGLAGKTCGDPILRDGKPSPRAGLCEACTHDKDREKWRRKDEARRAKERAERGLPATPTGRRVTPGPARFGPHACLGYEGHSCTAALTGRPLRCPTCKKANHRLENRAWERKKRLELPGGVDPRDPGTTSLPLPPAEPRELPLLDEPQRATTRTNAPGGISPAAPGNPPGCDPAEARPNAPARSTRTCAGHGDHTCDAVLGDNPRQKRCAACQQAHGREYAAVWQKKHGASPVKSAPLPTRAPGDSPAGRHGYSVPLSASEVAEAASECGTRRDCRLCVSLRKGAAGSRADGYLRCTKDEMGRLDDRDLNGPDGRGRMPTLEDRMPGGRGKLLSGSVPFDWIRADCADVRGSSTRCGLYGARGKVADEGDNEDEAADA